MDLEACFHSTGLVASVQNGCIYACCSSKIMCVCGVWVGIDGRAKYYYWEYSSILSEAQRTRQGGQMQLLRHRMLVWAVRWNHLY